MGTPRTSKCPALRFLLLFPADYVMKFEKNPDTFFVEEIMAPQLRGGRYFYYILEKRGIDSPHAIALIEEKNHAMVFSSGLKDSDAHTMQWICSEKELVPPKDDRIGLIARGKGSQRIFVGMHSANRFRITLRSLSLMGKKFLSSDLRKTAFPNYFDEQRFNEKTVSAGTELLAGNWKGAVKAVLTERLGFESEKSVEIKNLVAQNWGNWKLLSESVQIPESKKPIFRHLADGGAFKDAIPLLDRKSISIACRAAQSLEFNRLLGVEILKQNITGQKSIHVGAQELPVRLSFKGIKRELVVPPVFPKKTILKRRTYFHADKARARFDGSDCELEFDLRKSCYATILIKCVQAMDGE